MAIQWTEDLSVSVSEIDDQHKEIFNRINGLLDACNHGRGKEEVNKVISFIDDYVVTHFGMEEEHMIRQGYPGYAAHKALHGEFIAKLSDLKRQVHSEGVGVHTVIATNHLVVDWFVNHIRKVDTQLGAFLKTRTQ